MVTLGLCIRESSIEAVVTKNGRFIIGSKDRSSQSIGKDEISKVINKLRFDFKKIEKVHIALDLLKYPLSSISNLGKIAIIRLSYPIGMYEEPLIEWPNKLRKAVLGKFLVAHGGRQFDGSPLSEIDERELLKYLERLRGKVDAIALTSPFSTVYNEDESEAFEVLRKAAPRELPIYASHHLGDLDFAYRENATALNASGCKAAMIQVSSIKEVLKNFGIDAPTYFLQNNGLLMSNEYAVQNPVLTINSTYSSQIMGVITAERVQNGVLIDLDGKEVKIGPFAGGLPVIVEIVNIDGIKINSGGPLLRSLKSKISSKIVQKAIGSMILSEESKIYASTQETIQFVEKFGKYPGIGLSKHAGFLGAFGVANAKIGARIVKVFREKISENEAKYRFIKDAKMIFQRIGGSPKDARLSVEIAPLPTLPLGVTRLILLVKSK